MEPGPDSVVDFWLGFNPDDGDAFARAYARWFSATPEVDREIEARFGALVERAGAGELDAWARMPRGRLALIILLDQFPRNLHRGSGAAFALDASALALAREGIASGADRELSQIERVFFYMPLQHAESLEVQQESVQVFEALGAEPAPAPVAKLLRKVGEFARLHADIIARFGRFPHRNRQLGRATTEAEAAYLREGGPTFGQ